MAIVFTNTNTATSGTTSLTAAAPASLNADSVSILTVTNKPFSATPTTPAGWELVATATNGSTASGLDTGSVRTSTYIRRGSYGSTPITVTGADSCGQSIVHYKKSGVSEIWAVHAFTTGGDSTDGANYSATGAANVNAVAGDVILACTAVNSDAGTPSADDITATGLTFGTITARSDLAYTTGNNGRVRVVEGPITLGPETGAPTYVYTNASTQSGETIFVRLRATLPTLTATFNNSVDSPGWDIVVGNLVTGTAFTVFRHDTSGVLPSVAVRGLENVPIVTVTASDYEVPFIPQVQFELVVYQDGVITAEDIFQIVTPIYVAEPSFYTSRFYLKDVIDPTKSLSVSVSDLRNTNYDGQILASHHILGRKMPVVVTDVASGRRGTMKVVSANIGSFGQVDVNKIRDLLDGGHVLLFQSVRNPYIFRDMYFAIESYSEVSLGINDTGQELSFVWDINFVEVERPGLTSLGVSIAQWQDVLVDPAFASWTDVNSGESTWMTLLQRYI